MVTKTQQQPIFLDVSLGGDTPVVVVPENQDRYVLSLKDAIEACVGSQQQPYAVFVEFQKQFQAMLDHVGAWLRQRQDKVHEAYLTVRDSDVLFLLVQKSPTYDRQIEDELTDLDLAIAQDESLGLVRLNVLAIPPAGEDGKSAFLIPDRVWEYRLLAK